MSSAAGVLLAATPPAAGSDHHAESKLFLILGAGLVFLGLSAIAAVLLRRTLEGRRARGGLLRLSAIRCAGNALPKPARNEYAEEWHAWMRDLRELGAPWHTRVFEWLSIMFCALPVAVLRSRAAARRKVAE